MPSRLFHTSDNVIMYPAANHFYGGYGRLIWLGNVHCNGSEPSLLDCPASALQDTACNHSNDLYVRCPPATTSDAIAPSLEVREMKTED